MLLFKSKKLDERQLLIRGNIFKHGLFIISTLLFCNSILYNFWGFEWAEDRWPELTIMLFTITICSIEFIGYDIFTLTEMRQKFFIYFLGLVGVASIGLSVYEMISENISIIVDGKLSINVLVIIYGCMFIAVFVAYIARIIRNKKLDLED